MIKSAPVVPEPLWSKSFILTNVVTFIMLLAMYDLLTTLPLYAKHIGSSNSVAGFTISNFTFSACFSRPWLGNILDHRGRKNVLLIGIIIFFLVAITSALAANVWILLFLMVVNGIGWGAITTSLGTIAADLIPASRGMEGMGYYGVANTIAMAFGPLLGLYVIDQQSYFLIFITAAILAALGLIVALFINYEGKNRNPFPRNNDYSLNRTNKFPIIEKSAIIPSLIMFFPSITYGGLISFLPSYAKSQGIEDIGLFFTVYASVLLINRPMIGKLADRRGVSKILAPCLLILVISMFLLAFASNLIMFLLVAVLYGIGFGAIQPVLNALVVKISPFKSRGLANATFYSVKDLGISLGAAILGITSHKFNYPYAYGFSGVLVLTSIVIYFLALHPKLVKMDTNTD